MPQINEHSWIMITLIFFLIILLISFNIFFKIISCEYYCMHKILNFEVLL